MNAESILIVLVTFPDIDKARELGAAMVESQLAACVNLVPAIESIYRWQGAVQRDAEVLAIFKTTATLWPAFEQGIKAGHPYEVPEIVALKAEAVSEAYARWVGGVVRSEK
ncbi:MAG: divalent-cation tolerance protein CutA [Verrucomicrobiaceae bacterium]|nr:divalent-cation tolerance protein CutA [Verrucomicrobiaceae bacterium]